MLKIEFIEKLNDELNELVDDEFNKYAEKNGIQCKFRQFNFVARDKNR